MLCWNLVNTFDEILKPRFWVSRGSVLTQHDDYERFYPIKGQVFKPVASEDLISGGQVTASVDGRTVSRDIPDRRLRYLTFQIENSGYDEAFKAAFEKIRFYDNGYCLVSNAMHVGSPLGPDTTLNFVVEVVPSEQAPGGKAMLVRYLWNGSEQAGKSLYGSYCCSI